ncbi:MAG: hypothetical protein ACSLFR_11580 [Solirubrobacteraceae bacterium]
MNDAQKALLARLRELVEETPKSGAVTAAGHPLHVSQFSTAIESRADDGAALVEYVRSKVQARPTASYSALIKAGRPDLTPEALAADAEAPWASEFTEEDREAANSRLGAMLEIHRKEVEASEAAALEDARKIVARVSANRVANGKEPLTPDQEEDMLGNLAARRARGE